MKRKLDDDSTRNEGDNPLEADDTTSDDEQIRRPTKRMNMYHNTPRQLKDEKKRVLKISKRKLKQIGEPEADLLRSVLINNTFRRLKMEFREEKKTQLLKTGQTFSQKTSPLASGKNEHGNNGGMPNQADYTRSKVASQSNAPVIDVKCNTSVVNASEKSLNLAGVTRYEEPACQYTDTQNIQDGPVAMETSQDCSDSAVLEINARSTSQAMVTDKCSKNIACDMECTISTQAGSDVPIASGHVSKSEVCKSTQASSRVNIDICQGISNSDSDPIMDSTLQSDNEEIDVCTCTEEQTVEQTDEQMSPSRYTHAVIPSIGLDNKSFVQSMPRLLEEPSRNSCLGANKDSYYQQGVDSKTNRSGMLNGRSRDEANINMAFIPSFPWQRSSTETFSYSPLSISKAINYTYIDNSDSNARSNKRLKMGASQSHLQRTIEHCMPMATSACTPSIHTPHFALPLFHFSNTSELVRQSVGFYFHSPGPCRYSPSFLGNQHPLPSLRTVNNTERHQDSCFPSPTLISCNLQGHPIACDMRDPQRLSAISDMVVCT